jgi:hypothetical protein
MTELWAVGESFRNAFFLPLSFRVGLGDTWVDNCRPQIDLEEAVSRQYIGVEPGLRVTSFFHDVHVVLPLCLGILLNHPRREKKTKN